MKTVGLYQGRACEKLTDRTLDTETIELGFCEPAPNLGLVGAIDRYNALDEGVDSHHALAILQLVDRQRLFKQAAVVAIFVTSPASQFWNLLI